MSKKSSTLISDLTIGFAISVIVIALYLVKLGFLEGFDYKIYDLCAKIRKHQKQSEKIVLVTIDDQSIMVIGRWPWPRSYIAEIIEKISTSKPKVIGLNILFTEPGKILLSRDPALRIRIGQEQL